MFSLSLRKVVCETAATVSAELPVVKTPELEPARQALAQSEAAKSDFACLNDVFGELLGEECEYALSKW